jgi:precorrin-2 dehydrogenase/sirohydrochlorin ferrochelatase
MTGTPRVALYLPALGVGGAERVRAAQGADDVGDWGRRVDPALAGAATDDPAVNAAVEAGALEAGVLVNRADVGGAREPASVIAPAMVQAGPLQVAVSTAGTDPALSQAVRDRLREPLEGAAAVADAVQAVRSRLSDAGVEDAAVREAARTVALSDAVWDAARAPDEDAVAVALRLVRGTVDA